MISGLTQRVTVAQALVRFLAQQWSERDGHEQRLIAAVTLALPQDVQAQAYDFPANFFTKRVWRVRRAAPDAATLADAVALLRTAQRPLIVAGGGLIYSDATQNLRTFVERTGIPVGETQAGKGALPFDHACAVGAIGATGTAAANALAREGLSALDRGLSGWTVPAAHAARGRALAAAWDRTVQSRTTVVYVETDPLVPAPSSEAWWDVSIAEISQLASTRDAYEHYVVLKRSQEQYL